MNQLIEIKKFLKENSCDKAKESWKKSTPTAENFYGVYLKDVNTIVSKYVSGGFELVEELWRGGYLEEKILSAKILGRICGNNPDRALGLIESFSHDIGDWAVCDTLATQGIRVIAKMRQEEIFELSRKLVKNGDLWEKRFGIVLLINFKNEKSLKEEIASIVKQVENNKEHYVRKAVVWVKRSLKNV
jgi:3-methyladenine DNA glycosylase AlkD